MLRDILITLTSLALIGSGAWLALAGLVLAMFPEGIDLRALQAPVLSHRQLQLTGAGAALIGFAVFMLGAHVAALLFV